MIERPGHGSLTGQPTKQVKCPVITREGPVIGQVAGGGYRARFSMLTRLHHEVYASAIGTKRASMISPSGSLGSDGSSLPRSTLNASHNSGSS